MRAPSRLSRLGLVGALLGATGCAYRPARFRDAAPITFVADDRPIPRPARRTLLAELEDANAYVRRELVKDLDPRRPDEAYDVNALDDVPASSWFRRTSLFDDPLRGYLRDGPPREPWVETQDAPSSETPGAQVVIDARGLRYELVRDDAARPGMRTGALAVTSRLVFALGYRVAETYIVTTRTGTRVAATRWPIGVDLGPTRTNQPRGDDPNERFDPRDRRSLRAFSLAAAWLDIMRMPPRVLRDVYVGEPERGHVEHVFVGLDGGLGVGRFDAANAWLEDEDREDSNFFLRVFSFGLSLKPAAYRPETLFPSLGSYEEFVDAESFSPSPPFEPHDRRTPSDSYWMAKRLAAVPVQSLARAVRDAELPDPAQHALLELLASRRAQLVAWGYDRVAPLEAGLVSPANPRAGTRARVQLLDLALATGMANPVGSSYRVRFLDAQGRVLARTTQRAQRKALVVVELPEAVRGVDYVVVEVTALRDGGALPHPTELHLRARGDAFALVGVRHE